jgi:5S rRNA maturation endonuclease (ribonuclease M5)
MKPVFIVEGHKDAYQVDGAVGNSAHVIVTEGTKVNNRLKSTIENYRDKGNPIYILSDPDSAGEHLTKMINFWYPDIPRIEADYEECKYCKDLRKKKYKAGIEYASYKYLRNLLSPYVEEKGNE